MVRPAPPPESSFIISGVFDSNGNGNGIKTVIELYAKDKVDTPSEYFLATTRTGSNSSNIGHICTLTIGTVERYSYVHVALMNSGEGVLAMRQFFGVNFNYFLPTNEMGFKLNGRKSVMLYKNSILVDIFGTPGEVADPSWWDFHHSWFYRTSNRGPTAPTWESTEWTRSGADTITDWTSNDKNLNAKFPIKTYGYGKSSPALLQFFMLIGQ